jgi:hypothetical protein
MPSTSTIIATLGGLTSTVWAVIEARSGNIGAWAPIVSAVLTTTMPFIGPPLKVWLLARAAGLSREERIRAVAKALADELPGSAKRTP